MDQDQMELRQHIQRYEIGSRTCLDAAWKGGRVVSRMKEKHGAWARGNGFQAKVIECGISVRMANRWKKIYEGFPEGIPEGVTTQTECFRILDKGPEKGPEKRDKCPTCGFDGPQLTLDLKEARFEVAVTRKQHGYGPRVREDLAPMAAALRAEKARAKAEREREQLAF